MRIIGVNISHDTSVSELVDGRILNLYEEERCVREKYYDPNKALLETYQGLLAIDRYDLDKDVDRVCFATFDRRIVSYHINGLVKYETKWLRKFLADVTSKQLSKTRLDELVEIYPEFNYKIPKINEDEDIVDIILKEQYKESQSFHLDTSKHHEYHAWSGGYFAYDQDEVETAMCIVWDGGGAQSFFETYPGYQEIESIYKMDKGVPTLKYQVLSNHRVVGDLSATVPNKTDDCCVCYTDDTEVIDGAEIVFTSRPSMGMNFSQMSYALGTDEQGRAAGKVMGMASYGRTDKEYIFNRYNVSQLLEQKSFEHSCTIIDKALALDPTNKNIILSGGFSLNCTNNYRYVEKYPDVNFYVDPVCHDGGTAIGVALENYLMMQEEGYESSDECYVKKGVWS